MHLVWKQIAGGGLDGSWFDPEIRATRPSIVFGGKLYVGVYGERPGSAAVWSFDNVRWSKVYEAETQGHSFNRINALSIWRGRLIIGAGQKGEAGSATVLSHSSDTGEDKPAAIVQSFRDTAASFIDSLSANGDDLIVGLGGGEGRLEQALSILDGAGRTDVSPPSPLDGSYAMTIFRGRTVTGSYDRDRLTTVSVLDDSGPDPQLRPLVRSRPDKDMDKGGIVEALTVFNDRLFANFDRPVSLEPAGSRVSEGISPVWWFDGAAWRPALGPGQPNILSAAANFNSSTVFRNRFLFSSGSVGDRAGSVFVRVWALETRTGSVVAAGGGGIGGSWRDEDVGAANPRRLAWIYSMTPFSDGLAVTFTYGLGGGRAEVWFARPSETGS